MKKREAYELNHEEGFTIFYFTSKGPKGDINKVVEFTWYKEDLWNLGFGDIDDEDWDDSIVTDNKDMRKVVQTVANAVHIFSENYPERRIMIYPVGRRRKILYNRLFKEKIEEIELFFEVLGFSGRNSKWEGYSKMETYQVFVLKPKTINFGK